MLEHERTNSVFFGDRQALLNQIIELETEKDLLASRLNKSQSLNEELNEKLNAQSMRHIQEIDLFHQEQIEKEKLFEKKLFESEEKIVFSCL